MQLPWTGFSGIARGHRAAERRTKRQKRSPGEREVAGEDAKSNARDHGMCREVSAELSHTDVRFDLQDEDPAFRETGQVSSATPTFDLTCLFANWYHAEWVLLVDKCRTSLENRHVAQRQPSWLASPAIAWTLGNVSA